MQAGLSEILHELPGIEERIRTIQETLIANIVMIGEIPSPTFGETARMEFLVDRFTEYGLLNSSTDEIGNALGILPGTEGDKNIMLVAHMDTASDSKVDHTITVQPNYIVGPAVGDNALGVACVATLPIILRELGINLSSNLVLMGSARSLGRGNIEGLRFFLGNTDMPISAGLSVEGVRLGRLSYSSFGMKRCEISNSVPEEYDWSRFGAVGSIVTMNEVINKILEIPVPKRPRTNIVLGSVRGGTGFDTLATKANLRFEIRSESEEMVEQVSREIEDIAAEVSSHTGSEVVFNVYAQRHPGGIAFSHPLAENTRRIMHALNIKQRITPSASELSAFIDRNIPALTLGITNGENMNMENESIEIDPIFKGLAQLVGIILAVDRGYCNGN